MSESKDESKYAGDESDSDDGGDDDSFDPLHVESDDPLVQQLQRELKKSRKKVKEMESKTQTILKSVRDFQTQQKSLFTKYQDLRHDYKELHENMLKMLWEEMFDDGSGDRDGGPKKGVDGNLGRLKYDFLALKKQDRDLKEDEERVGEYDVGAVIGEGQFATVKSCYSTTKEKVMAVKIIEKKKVTSLDSLKRIDNELDVLEELAGKHPGILTLMDVLHGEKYLYMFTEKLDLDLFDFYDDHPNGVTETLGRLIILGIMEGVNFIHSRNIAHRDLKPENILLRRQKGPGGTEEYEVVLCDFGLCARVEEGMLMTDFCGSPGFFAPEMFVEGEYDGKQADVWSIGCILLELLVGHDTFGECWMTAYDSEYMKRKSDFRSEIQAAVMELKELRLPTNLSDFLQDLLSDVDGKKRPPVNSLLAHEWIMESEHGRDPHIKRRLSSLDSPVLQNRPQSTSEDAFADR
ncbi:hypothetical protein TrST_g12279 [Triparma strigata]|uniref:Protein kinase domain-containing protein n=1 Tax=Triparma strigata TaxID=1606541 RepID=A0A9W7BKS0_9STRA|nr:hypothetical protein TrST_g12279 [Triparma strigata]